MAGEGFDNLDDGLVCCSSSFGATIGVGGAGVCSVLLGFILKSAFDMATTGENSLRLISLRK